MSTAQPERKSKKFWAVSDQWEVKHVTGYECSAELWWVPELGYTLSEKHHLFSTATGARRKAIRDLQVEIGARQAALSQLHLEDTQ